MWRPLRRRQGVLLCCALSWMRWAPSPLIGRIVIPVELCSTELSIAQRHALKDRAIHSLFILAISSYWANPCCCALLSICASPSAGCSLSLLQMCRLQLFFW